METPPVIAYPAELPITAFKDDILRALGRAPALVVCGDTGSGKTTQLAKMLWEFFQAEPAPAGTPPGRKRIRIACTQPRRLAAVTVATRVAAETKTPLGAFVGYRHRFANATKEDTALVFMTDGVLLAETRHDPLLRRYDAIIIDEAHERSLNIDFLLGILVRILRRRADLKVVISSATLDVTRFSRFFGNAPVVTVPGRLYPIDVKYLPPVAEEERDLAEDVARAVEILPPAGDILVFLPGERDIRETAEHLAHVCPKDEIIPLLASLPASEQQRAFRLSPRRRIVLATNVAETSVTIPGIRAVIDSGLVRLARFMPRTQIQRLQIEPVSQASARQRTGRCGRLGPGTCIRLYSEEDFNAREAYTPPEVQRTSLAGVILTLLDLRLGDIEDFPFLDPPASAAVREGLKELLELGAICHRPDRHAKDGTRLALTVTGRRLVPFPVEPRLARILLAAADFGTLKKALPLVAALSCDDPRRRPAEEREKARQAHAPFRVPGSDFLGTLTLWTWWLDQTKDLSQAKARALAKKTYLSFPKMREWRDVTHQLENLARRLKLSFAEAPAADADNALHRALLTGFLGRIGKYDPEERTYRGAYGLRFLLHPASVLAKRPAHDKPHPAAPHGKPKPPAGPPEWVMAGELVDTAHLFARTVAAIDVAWLEPAAGALCRHHYHSPEYDPASGFVRATEQVTLHGLVIVAARRCDFSTIDPPLAREIFIRRALVDGDFPRPPPEVRANNALLGDIRRLAEKTRHPEFFDAERLAAHFSAILPPDVTNADKLRKWLRCDAAAAARLTLRRADWWPSEKATSRDFPETLVVNGARMRLSYRHTPDDEETDGITCTVRRADAAALRLWPADWLVPGALPEKLMWMLGVLPSAQRRVLSPLADTVATLMAHLKPAGEPLADAVRRTLYEQTGFRLAPDCWDRVAMPAHLKVRFRIIDETTGRTLALSRDRDEALARAGCTGSIPTKPAETPAENWIFGTIPETVVDDQAGWALTRYPALRDVQTGVVLTSYRDASSARTAHAGGIARLYLLALGDKARLPLRMRDLPLEAAHRLAQLDYAPAVLAADILAGAVKETLVRGLEPVRDEATFRARLEERWNLLVGNQVALQRKAIEILAAAHGIAARAEGDARLGEETLLSVQAHLAWLVCRGFPNYVPFAQIAHFPRYLKGLALRLERARNSVSGDREKEALVAPWWERYEKAVTGADKTKRDGARLAAYRWLVEEYRISVFAQELHTAVSVSPKRLEAAWADTRRA